MKPFWREQPLNEAETALLNAILAAHDTAARRENLSTQIIGAVSVGSGNYQQAIASAILSFGGLHGPITATVDLLRRGVNAAPRAADLIKVLNRKVPGWGSSFVNDGPDPIFAEIDYLLHLTQWGKILDDVTTTLHAMKLIIWPNAAAYTAASALELGIPDHAAFYLVVAGRLNAWSEIFSEKGRGIWDF